MTDDYMDAIEELWRNPQGASHHSEFLTFEDVTLDPPPLQSPPRVWVGGNSDAALKRTVRFGEAWHPIRPRLDWLKNEAMPKLRRMADEAGKPMPALCPRIACHISDSPLPEDQRMAGEGSLEQVHADLRQLEELDAQYVVFDTKLSSPTTRSPKHHEAAWPMLATVAEKLLDVERGNVRSL
jgi:alkanesulfonate monooxygenase SsuD/methylene tetrahydromethanopterin reductase-like flavin-dependent oxidoreductase (luciferase family)